MADPIVSLLHDLSLTRLKKMSAEAAEQIVDLEVQRAWIDRAIAQKDNNAGSPIPAANQTKSARPGRRKSNKRAAILTMLASKDLGHVWTANEVHDELERQGIDPSSQAAVRVALKRMFEAGEVERGGDAGTGWKLPSDTATREAPSAEQSSVSGYAPEHLAVNGSGQLR